MTRIRRAAAVTVAATVVAVPAGTSAARVPSKSPKLHRCSVGNPRGYGYTKLTSLSIGGGLACSWAQLVAAHHGGYGYRCRSKLLDRTHGYYDTRVTCHRSEPGGAIVRIRWTYREKTR